MKFLMMLPNILTGSRIFLSIALLFIDHEPELSLPFYIVYTICGLTDMVDGTIARALGVESKFGSKLDTLSDATMVLVMMFILVPIVRPTPAVIAWVLVILLLKFTAWVTGGMHERDYAPPHTIIDKVVSLMLFLYPYVRIFCKEMWIIYFLCAAATVAGIEKWIKLMPAPVSSKYSGFGCTDKKNEGADKHSEKRKDSDVSENNVK